jgi:sugar (pentulose or hexulose) kinase
LLLPESGGASNWMNGAGAKRAAVYRPGQIRSSSSAAPASDPACCPWTPRTTRAAAEIEELTERFGADGILARGGSALTSQAVGPKLLWLRRHEREVWAATQRVFMAS